MSKNNVSKKSKDSKRNNKKKIIIIVSVVVILLIIFGMVMFSIFYNNKKLSLKKIEIEAGMSIDEMKSLIKKNNELGDDVEISFKKLDGSEKLVTQVKYYKNGKEVSKEEAIEVVKEKEVLKKGYTKEEQIVGVGKYEVTVKDNKRNKTSKTTMTIKDTEEPNLILQDVEIEEGAEVSINNFIKSCTDNSNESCSCEYTDDKGEKIDNIDLSVGERKINIVAIDSSKNRSSVKTANLKVNAKQQEQQDETQQSTSNNNKQNNTNSNYNSSNNNGSVATNSNSSASYDTSNPIVAKALSLVGSSMNCTVLVDNALSAAGKSLTRNNVPCSHPIFKEPELASMAQQLCTDPSASLMVGGINVVKYFGTPVASPLPGDVLFYDNGGYGSKHVAIYIGNGQAVHGGWKGNSVVISSMYVAGASTPRAYRM